MSGPFIPPTWSGSTKPKKPDYENRLWGSGTFLGGTQFGPSAYEQFGRWGYLAQVMGGAETAPKFWTTSNGETMREQGQFFILADPKTKSITDKSVQEISSFLVNISNPNSTNIIAFSNLLKRADYLPANYKVSNVATPEYRTAMLAAAKDISFMNFSNFAGSEKPAGNPYSLQSGLKHIAKIGGAGAAASGTTTSVSKTFTSFSEAEARGILESFYASALGRRPTDKEVNKFRTVINSEAAKRPGVTSTTYGTGGSSSRTTDGYSQADAELQAREMAESKPGANAFITSTKYMDTFLSLLEGKVGRP